MLGGKGFGAWKTLASGSLEQPGRGRPTQVVNRREVAHPRGAVARAMMKLFWRREQRLLLWRPRGPRELEGARGSCVSHRDGLAGAWESGSVYVTGLRDCVHTHPCTHPGHTPLHTSCILPARIPQHIPCARTPCTCAPGHTPCTHTPAHFLHAYPSTCLCTYPGHTPLHTLCTHTPAHASLYTNTHPLPMPLQVPALPQLGSGLWHIP